MSLTSAQSKLVMVPFLYQVAFNIFRQIKVPSNPAVIFFDLIFVICVFLFCNVIKDRKMFRNLIGNSSFDIRDMKCSLLMSTFIILVFLVAGLYRYNLGEPPCYSFLQRLALCIISPFFEELVCRCFLMSSLRGVLSDGWLLIVSILYWLSVHELATSNWGALVAFAAISGCCYLRFTSLRWCFLLHALWNSIMLLRL